MNGVPSSLKTDKARDDIGSCNLSETVSFIFYRFTYLLVYLPILFFTKDYSRLPGESLTYLGYNIRLINTGEF